jgi:glutathione peroxidase
MAKQQPDLSTTKPSIYDLQLTRLNGELDSLDTYRGKVLLVVNVASLCGRTPQYAKLQDLYTRHAHDGLTVLGFPCNQFGDEEPGSADEIADFCQTNYGVSFPMFAKVEVNGPSRHALYATLARAYDDEGSAGDIAWNFEKFLIARDGLVARRFRHTMVPSDPTIVSAIEALL